MNYPKYLLNSKTLFSQLMNTLEKLDSGEIDVAQAAAISKLHNSAQGWINLEIKRAAAASIPEVREHMRNLELKNFDSLPE